jgi:hypothetical protein
MPHLRPPNRFGSFVAISEHAVKDDSVEGTFKEIDWSKVAGMHDGRYLQWL